MRVKISRIDEDGSVVDGTAEKIYKDGSTKFGDFRDLDGNELPLPAGSKYTITFEAVT